MSNQISKKAIVPASARIKTYFDTQQVTQNGATVNFFPANSTRKITRNNYVGNPFPGELKRRVLALSFEVIKQFIEDDEANNINARAIINSLKDAGVILQADNDNKEFLRVPISKHSNFSGTGIHMVAGTPNTVDAAVSYKRIASLQSAEEYRLADPFDLAVNQTLSLSVHFEDASVFPSDADWTASGQGLLYLRANIVVAEMKPEK
jgi:hypothetical protein